MYVILCENCVIFGRLCCCSCWDGLLLSVRDKHFNNHFFFNFYSPIHESIRVYIYLVLSQNNDQEYFMGPLECQ